MPALFLESGKSIHHDGTTDTKVLESERTDRRPPLFVPFVVI